jgi:transcriptional regulator with XRE-family HTH domain
MRTKPGEAGRVRLPAPEAADALSSQICRRVRELRAQRGWSLDALSKACGVSRSMLSQIERNQANPTLAVAFRIAQAFGMSLGDLVETPRATSAIAVIRASDRGQVYRSDKDCMIRTLSPLHLEKDVEIYEVQLKEGGALRSSPHYQGTREFLTIQRGKVRLESAEDTERLERGDSASYRADVPHAIVNTGRGEALVVLVVIYQ